MISALAPLLFLPSSSFAESALDWISGDWGVEASPDQNCATYPLRIKVTEKGKMIVMSFPNHDALFPTFQAPDMNGRVLSSEGLTILFHNDLRDQPFYIALSADRTALQITPGDEINSQPDTPIYTRCPNVQPGS